MLRKLIKAKAVKDTDTKFGPVFMASSHKSLRSAKEELEALKKT